jgi:hypothetical protein
MWPDNKSVINKSEPTFRFEMKVLRDKVSKCSMKMLATIGDKEDPMVVPSVYS